MWGWIKEPPGRTDRMLLAAGWAGVISLPRTLDLVKLGKGTKCGKFQGGTLLTVAPAAVVNQLRMPETHTEIHTVEDKKNELAHIPQLYNLSAEIDIDLLPFKEDSKSSFDVSLTLHDALGVDTDPPFLSIRYEYLYSIKDNAHYGQLTVGNYSCRIPVIYDAENCGAGDHTGRSLRVIIDASAVEIFAGYDCVITSRSYNIPKGKNTAIQPTLDCKGDDIETCNTVIGTYSSWQMKPISSDRLTT